MMTPAPFPTGGSVVPPAGLAITADDLLVVLGDLWEAAFGCSIAEAEALEQPDPSSRWWAAADLLDDEGVLAEVVVAVDEASLAAVARLTFGVEDPEIDQMTDVAAEAANIMGGNVKGILSMRTRLSWPRTGRGAPPLRSGHRTSVHAVDERGRRMEAHVVDTRRPGEDPGASRNED